MGKMDPDKKHKITLTELEMELILQTINKTTYLGEHSNLVSDVRAKMTINHKEIKP